jgi:hypothetical protein
MRPALQAGKTISVCAVALVLLCGGVSVFCIFDGSYYLAAVNAAAAALNIRTALSAARFI